jgi:ABC-2 type transport system ATP-binding protein
VIIINHGVKVFDDTLQKLQLNLGEKKIVELTLEEPVDSALITDKSNESIKVIEQKSPLELTLEVDTSKIAISKFIETISQKFKFTDIAVKELPMEEIITEIYNDNKGAMDEKINV